MSYRNGPRRRHSAEFKMEVVSACGELGASVAAVALAFGLNANLVRPWLRGRGFKRTVGALAVPAAPTCSQRFSPLALPAEVAARPAGDIRVEVRRANLQVSVSWPQSAGAHCAACLRELRR
jgi:transposase-like protein